jgi:hypothetical protein
MRPGRLPTLLGAKVPRRFNSGPLYWKDQKPSSGDQSAPAGNPGSSPAAAGEVVKEVPVLNEAPAQAAAGASGKSVPPNPHVSYPVLGWRAVAAVGENTMETNWFVEAVL